jgi:hypothetical protein
MKGALPLTPTVFYYMYEAAFLDEIQTKVLRVFLLAIQLRTISTIKLLYTVKENGGKHVRKPYPLPYMV